MRKRDRKLNDKFPNTSYFRYYTAQNKEFYYSELIHKVKAISPSIIFDFLIYLAFCLNNLTKL